MLRPAALFVMTVLGTCAARAQEGVRDFNHEGMSNYCFYNGKAYSIGSMMCIPQSKTALVCQTAPEEQNKSGTARPVWKPKPADVTCK